MVKNQELEEELVKAFEDLYNIHESREYKIVKKRAREYAKAVFERTKSTFQKLLDILHEG